MAVFVLSGTTSSGTPPIASKARTWASIQSGSAHPTRPGEGEARSAEHGDEDLRHADFAGEAIDDDRHAVAGIVDEQALAGGVRLAHRHRQRSLEGPVQLAEPRVAVAAGVGGDIFVPQDQEGDVLALESRCTPAQSGSAIRRGRACCGGWRKAPPAAPRRSCPPAAARRGPRSERASASPARSSAPAEPAGDLMRRY